MQNRCVHNFIVTWPGPFVASRGGSALQEILVDLRDLEYLDIAATHPLWVTISRKMVLGVPRKTALEEIV